MSTSPAILGGKREYTMHPRIALLEDCAAVHAIDVASMTRCCTMRGPRAVSSAVEHCLHTVTAAKKQFSKRKAGRGFWRFRSAHADTLG